MCASLRLSFPLMYTSLPFPASRENPKITGMSLWQLFTFNCLSHILTVSHWAGIFLSHLLQNYYSLRTITSIQTVSCCLHWAIFRLLQMTLPVTVKCTGQMLPSEYLLISHTYGILNGHCTHYLKVLVMLSADWYNLACFIEKLRKLWGVFHFDGAIAGPLLM